MDDREQRLDQAVAAFHQSQEDGDDPKAADWIGRYPDLAPELEEHFQMDGLVGWVADADVPRAPGSGTMFGPYRIVRVIGRGGAGVVYEAEHATTGRLVALKVLPTCVLSDRRLAERFRREIAVLASLDHPHILPILDSGEHAGIPYFAMPKVDGSDLRAVVRKLRRADRFGKRTSPESWVAGDSVRRDRSSPDLGGPTADHSKAVAAIGIQAALALDYAHAQGVTHRDVKPSNLLIDASGAVFVTDFGLAHAHNREDLTETGDLAGTLRYLSPERLRGWSDPRSDVYSLGLTLYELVTLRPAFDAVDRTRLLQAIAQDTPKRPRSWNREIPRDLETIIRKAIEREPAHRYPSAKGMADDLQRFLDGRPIKARRVNTVRRLWSWTRRNKAKAAGIAVVTLAVVGFIAVAFWAEHIRRSAAESSARKSQFQAELLKIEKFRTGEHLNGWSSEVMERAQKASKIRRDERLRDQAAASLAGIDVTDRLPLPGIGGSSVAFNAEGTLLLIGGRKPDDKSDSRARIYDVQSQQITHISNQDGAGPVAFTKAGEALQLAQVENVGLCVWNVVENRVETVFQEAPAEMPSVLTLSPDGKFVAAAILVGDAPMVRVWDSASGRILRDLAGDATALAFSPECERLAAGTERGDIRVWSPSDDWSATDQPATSNRIQALCFTRDSHVAENGERGWLLAAGDAGAEIVILDLMVKTTRARCVGSVYEVRALAFSDDGTILASGGRHAARLWDAATGNLLLLVEGGDTTRGMAFSKPGDRLAITHQPIDGAPWVDVWNVEHDRGIATLRGLTGPISKVVLSPDGQRIAALSHDWRIGVWDIDGGLLGVLNAPKGLFADNAALAFRADGRQLAISSGQSAQLWDLDPIRLAHEPWPLPPGLSDVLAFRSETELMLCRFECVDGVHLPYENPVRRVVQLRNLLGSNPIRPVAELFGYQRLNASAATPDGRMFVLNLIYEGPDYFQHAVSAIDSRTGKPAWSRELQKAARNGLLVMDPVGVYVVSDTEPFGRRQSFELLRLADGKPIFTKPAFASLLLPIAMGPQAKIVARQEATEVDTNQFLSVLRLNHADSANPILRFGFGGDIRMSTAVFDHNGSRIAWGQGDGTVRTCDLAEVHARLGEMSDLEAALSQKIGDGAVKPR